MKIKIAIVLMVGVMVGFTTDQRPCLMLGTNCQWLKDNPKERYCLTNHGSLFVAQSNILQSPPPTRLTNRLKETEWTIHAPFELKSVVKTNGEWQITFNKQPLHTNIITVGPLITNTPKVRAIDFDIRIPEPSRWTNRINHEFSLIYSNGTWKPCSVIEYSKGKTNVEYPILYPEVRTNIIREAIASGEVCALIGHIFEQDFNFTAFESKTSTRTCRVCGKSESKKEGEWK